MENKIYLFVYEMTNNVSITKYSRHHNNADAMRHGIEVLERYKNNHNVKVFKLEETTDELLPTVIGQYWSR